MTTCASGRAIASGMPGTPPPEPTSRMRTPGRRREMRHDGQRIEQVMRDHPRRFANRRQVVGLVPLGEQGRDTRPVSRAAPSPAQARALRCRRRGRRRASPLRATRVMRTALPCRACRGGAALQMHQQQRDRRRRDAGNARGLADRFRLVQVELLLHLGRQSAHAAVVEIGRQPRRLHRQMPRDFVVLAIDVAGVLGRDLDLLAPPAGSATGVPGARQREQRGVGHVRVGAASQ